MRRAISVLSNECQCCCYLYLLRKFSNLGMVQFWQDFGQLWPKNAYATKNPIHKLWFSYALETRYKGCTLRNFKYLALLVQILTWGVESFPFINLTYVKKPVKYRVNTLQLPCFHGIQKQSCSKFNWLPWV